MRIDERPSVELRDWMYNDILLTLWESRPKFALVRDEGSEIDTERVVMDDDNELTKIETLNRGVSSFNLFPLLIVNIYSIGPQT